MVFAGTNDYNSSVPLGEWWHTAVEEANYDGTVLKQPRRHMLLDTETLRGRVNIAMRFMKERFPRQQIILLTPIHRGFATFSESMTPAIGVGMACIVGAAAMSALVPVIATGKKQTVRPSQ